MQDSLSTTEFRQWITNLKYKMRSTQIQIALKVNSLMLDFYFESGETFSSKERVWGAKLLQNVAAKLKAEFPDLKGFSITNLKYFCLFYKYVSFRSQLGDELLVNFPEDLKGVMPTVEELEIGLEGFQYES